ncbi:MAG: peptide deformylase [Dysgonomonas sp.]|nr:peptide deformylase [Dysgonomonas sp.]
MAQFTDQEIALINSMNETSSMRVLLIDNPEDSLVLRKKCSDIDVSKNKKEIALLIERMKATMETESGVGIAAPQVGICKNIFLFTRLDQPDYPVIAAINPRIVNHSEETICFENDGCLSIPGVSGNSIRYPWIEVEYTNEKGELIKEKLEGYSRSGNFTGIIFQHEYDHLQGVLFIDKLCPIINDNFSEQP